MSFCAVAPRALRAAAAAAARPAITSIAMTRFASTDTAVAAPMLANIEKKWEAMPPQEQAELYMALRDRMRANWHELTLAEKKAAYWISFGPHGPRAETPKGEGWKQLAEVAKYVAISGIIYFTIRQFANKEQPKTMTKEWQEMTNEYAKTLPPSPTHPNIYFRKRKPARLPPETYNYSKANNQSQREKLDPISGISSEGYTGKGFIQSK
ncbi:Cytochrome c oxidase subunit 5A [Ascosphaera aggregata]|nr:Cytochrome c oxidase subunit 5A [Ascosphaera aggregata]